MSRTMSTPWLNKSILQLLTDSNTQIRRSSQKLPRVCQVIATFEHLRAILISDKQNSITVFLSNEALEKLAVEGMTIRSLRNSIIKIEDYHFSVMFQSAGDRDMTAITKEKITRPLVVCCSTVVYLGADDCTTIGDPVDLNRVLKATIIQIGYTQLVERLRLRQFPDEECLPDFGKSRLDLLLSILL